MNNNIEVKNNVTMIGKISSPFVLDHELYGLEFYTFELTITRKSGYEDKINVTTIKDNIINKDGLFKYTIDNVIKITGSLRSYDKEVNNKRKLILTIFATSIEVKGMNEPHLNSVHIIGSLVKDPVLRITPKGIKIVDLMIAVRRYNKLDYIPCIAWNASAVIINKEFKTGDNIEFTGRFQSRIYVKTLTDKKLVKRAYELSVYSKVYKVNSLEDSLRK